MNAHPYRLSVDGHELRVLSFVGKEAVSDLWRFDLVVTAEAGGDALERTALGERATLLFEVGATRRAFYGVVAAVRLAEVHRADHALQYHVRVVPRLWLLKQRKRSRVFQHERVPEIVSAVLREAGIGVRWQLGRAYPAREYVTQYEETDYAFVRRLLAEAGIFFYFPAGPALDDGALAASAALSVAAAAGSAALDLAGGSGAGSLLGAARGAAEPLVPGDTVIGADDAAFYPPLRGDDAAALAASTAAALAPGLGGAAGAAMGGMAGAALGTAAAVAGSVLAAVTGGGEAPVLRFLQHDEAAVERHDKVTRFALQNTVRPTAAAFRDYDPERPLVRLESVAVSTQPFPPSPLELAAIAMTTGATAAAAAGTVLPQAAGALDAASGALGAAGALATELGSALGQKVPFEIYEHHSPFLFPKWAFANDEAPRILRQKRRRASVARGEGECPDLCAGHRFALDGHPAAHLDASYVVVAVEHHGTTRPEPGRPFVVYRNAFECAPAEMAYVPARPRRRSVQVALTATVVGPPNEDIHVDARGQIKVQFHWDRAGLHNAQSSCWIRAMQPWAGASWGHQFIPRVGMEVVVVFEGGDPDKPMVLGSLYNGTHPPPFQLPRDRTRSGIRTQSSPGGGYNELSFEDANGKEQILLRAHRNLDEQVGRDHTLAVQHDQMIHVLGQRLDTIERELRLVVKGDQATEVGGNRLDVVAGDADLRVAGDRTTRVEGTERQQVRGRTELEHLDDLSRRVLGAMTTIVGTQDKKRSWTAHAEGTAALSGSERVELRSDQELVLAVGTSSIRISKDKVEISADAVTARGGDADLSASDDGLVLSSKGDAELVVKKKLVLKTDGASVAMQKEVKIDGTKILLNSPESASDPAPKEREPPTRLELRDQDGKPLPRQRFLITLEDGSDVSGVTDEDGNAELELPSGGKVRFPDATLPDDAPGGTLEPYVVRQGDYSTSSPSRTASTPRRCGATPRTPSSGRDARIRISCIRAICCTSRARGARASHSRRAPPTSSR
ncbi:MAG: type VI secretion system tip protein VgrG [Polyangiaceae bacterium]|nr:type VI secretion system tip protein VgrG [Polyangiaceae bacterium]